METKSITHLPSLIYYNSIASDVWLIALKVHSSTLLFLLFLLLYSSMAFRYLSLSFFASSSNLFFSLSVIALHISDRSFAMSPTDASGCSPRISGRFSPQKWKYEDLKNITCIIRIYSPTQHQMKKAENDMENSVNSLPDNPFKMEDRN